MASTEQKSYYFGLFLESKETFGLTWHFINQGNAADNKLDILPGKYTVYLQIYQGIENDAFKDWKIYNRGGKAYFGQGEEPRFNLWEDKCSLAVELNKSLQREQNATTRELVPVVDNYRIKLSDEMEISSAFDNFVVHGDFAYNLMQNGRVMTKFPPPIGRFDTGFLLHSSPRNW